MHKKAHRYSVIRLVKSRAKILFCLAILLINFFTIDSLANQVFASPNNNTASKEYKKIWRVDTSLQNGNILDAFHLDVLPMFKKLATGTMPGDKLTWSFEKAPFYSDNAKKTAAEENLDRWANNLRYPSCIEYELNEAITGVYDISVLDCKMETREITDEKGEKFYRCAITELFVAEWRSPYGAICSRNEALEYYNKCQKQINLIISKVRAARQSNGKPLTSVQKIKWIHDWLITSVEYDFETLDLEAGDENSQYKYMHLWNEYGAIIEGKAVCEGYTYAFKAIVDELVKQTGEDIECEEAVSPPDENYESHSWNRVKINGKWYHVDVTTDDCGETDFTLKTGATNYFLVSDYELGNISEHPGVNGYTSRTSATEKATDRKYEGKKWPRYKKDLKECTVTLKKQDATYIYNGKRIIPGVIVKYGSNVLPREAYQVIRTDKHKTGTAKIKIIPAKNCYILSGSIKGPDFKIVNSKISGTAKSTKKYKLGKSKSIRPFDKTFRPFSTVYKYSKRSVTPKINKSLTLKKGKDYTVKYENNKKIGWAKATITLKGNYTGKITVKYKIIK